MKIRLIGLVMIILFPALASLGVVKAAEESGRYVLWFDSSGYGLAPGTIIGSTVLRNDRASYETVKASIEDKLELGKARVVGIQEGYIDFVTDDENYLKFVSPEIREKVGSLLKEFKSGTRRLEMPTF